MEQTPPNEPGPGKKKRRRRLTDKQKRLIRHLTENPDATLAEAALAAGYDTKNPGVIGAQVLQESKNVRETMAEMMEKDPRLKRSSLLERLAEGLGATQKTYAQNKFGEFTDEKTDPDFAVRHHYLKLAVTLSGDLVKKTEVSGGANPIKTIDLGFLKQDDLLRMIEETNK